jgi:hypothetical protein
MDNFFLDRIESPDNPYTTTLGLILYPSDENVYILYKVVKEEKYAIILKLYLNTKFEFKTIMYFKMVYSCIFANNKY